MSNEIPTNLFSPQTVEWMRISRNINNYVDEIFETLKKDNKLHLRETEDLYKLTSGPSNGWISNFASYVNAWIVFSRTLLLLVGITFAEWSVVYCCAWIVWFFSFHLYCSYVSLLSKQLRKADEQLRIYYNLRTLVLSLEYWQRQKRFWEERQAEIKDKVKERGSEYDGDN